MKTVQRARFYENVSFFVKRWERKFEGDLCFPCTTRVFLTFTAFTLLATWWGIKGLFVGPAYIAFNVFEYVKNAIRFAFDR